jgi:hypothetical protein
MLSTFVLLGNRVESVPLSTHIGCVPVAVRRSAEAAETALIWPFTRKGCVPFGCDRDANAIPFMFVMYG